MADFIIRTPYTFRDERLFPPGWRSFTNLCYGVNHIEVTNEILGVLGVSGSLYNEVYGLNDIVSQDPNSEYIGMNDLTGAIVDIISKFNMEISNEYEGLNKIETPQTIEYIGVNELAHLIVDVISKFNMEISNELTVINSLGVSAELEYTGINYLSSENIAENIGIIDILENPVYFNEIDSINRIDDEVSFESISYGIHIYIDEVLVDDYVESWTISIDSKSYVNSASVVFVDKHFFSICSPAVKIGDRRIRITIDGIDYQFMIEKREPIRTPKDNSYSIWGRSYIATLDLPYNIPITDKEVVYDSDTDTYYSPDDASYVPHVWQLADTTVREIMESVIGDLVLDFQINDFIVKHGTFTVSYQSSINIINTLAKIVGASVRTDLNDKVIIRYADFNVSGDSVATFTDLEDIFMLNESLSYPKGYNKVLIKGYEDPIVESSTNIKLELDSELNGDKTRFNFGDEIWIRLYKAPFSVTYDIECSLGQFNLIQSDTSEEIERESSGFAGKTLTTDYPINTISLIERYNCENISSSDYSFTSGYNIVTSKSNIQDEPVLISYTSQYDLYRLVVNMPCDPLTFTEVLSQITAKQN